MGLPPSVRPVAARTSRDPFGSLTSEGTSSPERTQRLSHGFKVHCIHMRFVCVQVQYLMEDERLADVAPAAGGRAVVQDQQEEQQQYNTGRGIHRVYHEHHDHTADNTQQTCVPREKLKCWPGKKEKKS